MKKLMTKKIYTFMILLFIVVSFQLFVDNFTSFENPKVKAEITNNEKAEDVVEEAVEIKAEDPVQIIEETQPPAAPIENQQSDRSTVSTDSPVTNLPKVDPSPIATKEPAAPTPKIETVINYETIEQQIVDLVNKERADAGLPALKVNKGLADVAEKKAEDLRDKNYFAHKSPTYGSAFDMMKQFGINYSTAGENLAKGQKTSNQVMYDWMNSAGHRANILNTDFTEIGVGFVTDSVGTTYWVQHFIKP